MVFEEALDIAQVARESREKAEAGDAAAQLQLARCYFTGSGVSQSTSRGMEWLRKAADQNYADAQCLLAECYYQGKGVAKDEVEKNILILF